MNKVANVVYAYSAKNDDELELKVGDRIEVIGVEEEGMYCNNNVNLLKALFSYRYHLSQTRIDIYCKSLS